MNFRPQVILSFFIFKLLIGGLIACYSVFAISENVEAEESQVRVSENINENSLNDLGDLDVWLDSFAQKMGTQNITRDDIKNLPTANGMISELLKSNPNVQFSSSGSTSQAQGEIAPENVSIHGEKFYNNSWMLDGMSNNDNVNPGSNNGSLSSVDAQKPFLLPDGGTQSFWVNSSLIESVDVYDSNISAKYGQFTGGVIDARLKDPDIYDASGSVSYRITKDEWTKFHFESEESESSFESAGTIYDQPQFLKQIYSLNVNQPISDSVGLLFSYNRTESVIPFHHTYLTPDLWEDQHRLAETYLLKGLYEADNGDSWRATLLYSPHESRYLFNNIKNGGYQNTGGGYRINVDWLHLLNHGMVTSSIGYKNTANDVEYEESDAYTWNLTPSIDWYSSDSNALEGGYGESITEKQTLTFQQDFEMDPFNLITTQNKMSFGWSAELAQAAYERKVETNIYIATGLLVPAICNDGDDTCIAGEQAADIALRYPESSTQVSNDHYAFYFEDQIQWKQLELTPGLRADYDQFLNNIDIAPRFAASYDVFNNKKTTLFGGLNRYYANSLLSYALSEATGSAVYYSRDDYDQGWVYENDKNYGGSYKSSDLATPYSDEVNIGLSQRIKNSEWTVKWVHREGKRQFTKNTETDDSNQKIYTLTNDGSSESDSFSLSGRLLKPIAIDTSKLFITIGANYRTSKSDFTSYDPDPLSEISDVYRYYADGNIMTYDELLTRNDYNFPWTLFATVDIDIQKTGVTWSQNYRYTAGYSQYTDTGEDYSCTSDDAICGDFVGDASIYEKVNYKNRFVLDWRFTYKLPIYKTTFELSLDILNVLDEKVEGNSISSSSSISYTAGRTFWLGGKFNWE